MCFVKNCNLHYCQFKINEKKQSIVNLFFSPVTEIVSNRVTWTEVRTEPWHLCTMPALIYIVIYLEKPLVITYQFWFLFCLFH